MQHAQLLDALTRTRLDEYFATLNDVSLHLQSLAMPPSVLREPFAKLEQWRHDAHRQIDEFAEKKQQEIQRKVDEYRPIFDRLKNEQLEKVSRYKQKVAELFRQSQVTQKDLANLKRTVEQIQDDLRAFDQHSVEVTSTRPFTPSLHLRLRCNEWKPPSPSSSSSSSISAIVRQLEFHLKYVRLSGLVTSHDVLVGVNGTVGDLIEQFFSQQDRIKAKDHKRRCYLATEVGEHQIRQRLNNEISLLSIFNRIESLVLYETPLELNSTNLQHFSLVFCRFEEGLPWEIQFGLPFLLHLPRVRCRGRDIIDLLDQTLKTYFPLLHSTTTASNVHFQVRLLNDENGNESGIILNEWTERVVDEHLAMAENVTLVINVIQHDPTHLPRRDGITRLSDRRRKSRK